MLEMCVIDTVHDQRREHTAEQNVLNLVGSLPGKCEEIRLNIKAQLKRLRGAHTPTTSSGGSVKDGRETLCRRSSERGSSAPTDSFPVCVHVARSLMPQLAVHRSHAFVSSGFFQVCSGNSFRVGSAAKHKPQRFFFPAPLLDTCASNEKPCKSLFISFPFTRQNQELGKKKLQGL